MAILIFPHEIQMVAIGYHLIFDKESRRVFGGFLFGLHQYKDQRVRYMLLLKPKLHIPPLEP